MQTKQQPGLVDLPLDGDLWDRFFSVFPLVIIGTKEDDGKYDLAPKNMAMPLGWSHHFGFVCSPAHRTYHNIRRHRAFSVSYPRPTAILLASLAAAPREADGDKPSLALVDTFPGRKVDAPLMESAYVWLECSLREILDGLGPNSLVIGDVVAAAVHEDALREADRDDADQIHHAPLLAYLSPGRITTIETSTAFPFHRGFSR